MITISISAEAYQAIMGGPPDASDRDASGGYPLTLHSTAHDRLTAARGPGESYSDVILRLAKTSS
jgi:predicted CopG family antitoxin